MSAFLIPWLVACAPSSGPAAPTEPSAFSCQDGDSESFTIGVTNEPDRRGWLGVNATECDWGTGGTLDAGYRGIVFIQETDGGGGVFRSLEGSSGVSVQSWPEPEPISGSLPENVPLEVSFCSSDGWYDVRFLFTDSGAIAVRWVRFTGSSCV